MHKVDLGLMVLLGLTSSLHCVGMCGPLVAVATAPLCRQRERCAALAFWQLSYQLGRGLAYAAAGALLATLGLAVGTLAGTRRLGGGIQLAVGLAIVGLGLWHLIRAGAAPVDGEGWLTRRLRRLVTAGRARSLFALGLLTGLLPCGVLYAALGRAFIAGSPGQGALLMFAFWLGTAPLLAGLGLASAGLLRLAGRLATPLVLIAMLTTGTWLATKGLRNLVTPAQAAPAPSPTEPSCPHHPR